MNPATCRQPFPTTLFPSPIRNFIEKGAKALQCDESMLALPVLCVGGGILGGSRRLQIKSSWLAPPILWGCILGESGTQKSPAMRLVMAPLREFELAEHQKHESPAGGAKGPTSSSRRRVIVSDTTTEALAPIAQQNAQGLLMARDELAAFFGGFDRYASTQGGDEPFFLSAFDGESVTVDRKMDREHIFIPSLALSIIGTCQPAIFSRLMSNQRREAGMLARFLVVHPPRRVKRFQDWDLEPEIAQGWRKVVNRLLDLEMAENADGQPTPWCIGRTDLVQQAYREFFNTHNALVSSESSHWRAFLSKAEQLPLRLALILHHFEWASGAGPTGEAPDENFDVSAVNDRTMQRAIAMTKWFIEEAGQVYDLLETKPEERLQDELEEYVRRHGGAMTIRNLLRGPRRFRVGPQTMHLLLSDLVRQGRGQWSYVGSTSEGGMPTSEFRVA